MEPEVSDPATILDELAGEAADVDVSASGEGLEYSRAGRLFATRSTADVVEVRLGEEIAEAARRTPDTASSTRGPDWVSFGPLRWDDNAFDRLEAWFRVAWRLAAGRS